jgi:hypothetical protein
VDRSYPVKLDEKLNGSLEIPEMGGNNYKMVTIACERSTMIEKIIKE